MDKNKLQDNWEALTQALQELEGTVTGLETRTSFLCSSSREKLGLPEVPVPSLNDGGSDFGKQIIEKTLVVKRLSLRISELLERAEF